MKKEWSSSWSSSVQPRKQRKYRHNAPLHVRHKFLSAGLSPELRRRFKKRSMPIRKGDEVEVMRGSVKGLRGTVNRTDLSKSKVYVEEIKIKKVDGSEINRPLQPSNVRIVRLNLDDKMRQRVLDRTDESKTTIKPKETEKEEHSKDHPKKEKPKEDKPKRTKTEKKKTKRKKTKKKEKK